VPSAEDDLAGVSPWFWKASRETPQRAKSQSANPATIRHDLTIFLMLPREEQSTGIERRF
jgi:hypothetical protein